VADLTLPGSIPGLLRRGSPVFWCDEETPYVVTWIGPWPDSDPNGGAIALIAPGSEPCIGMCVNATADLALDLFDATGRVHAAWWLAEHLIAGAPETPSLRLSYGPAWIFSDTGWRAWQLLGHGRILGHGRDYWTVGRGPVERLDADDPRLLPDGSRLVDAMALHAVCLHVAGLEVSRG